MTELLLQVVGLSAISACWSVFCLWAGFKMGCRVNPTVPAPLPKPDKEKPENLVIDRQYEDPWEDALHGPPPERITGDMQ